MKVIPFHLLDFYLMESNSFVALIRVMVVLGISFFFCEQCHLSICLASIQFA